MKTILLLTVAASCYGDELTASRVGVSATETRLSLAQAVEMALRNNLDIEIEKSNPALATQSIRAALGAFDPTFQYRPGYDVRNTPVSSTLQGVDGLLAEKQLNQNAYLRWKSPWQGASLGLDFENNRQVTNSPFASLTPFFNSRLVISYTQPLLRNRLLDRERNELRIRRKNLEISDFDFRLRVIDVVSQVEQGYWDLVAARQDVTVTRDAVDLAAEQYARNQRMIDSGSLAPVELSASKAELERRRDAYFASLGTLTAVENGLKSLLAPSRNASLWSDQLIPLDTRSAAPRDEVADVKSAVTEALAQRPELKQMILRMESNQYDQQYAAEQVKPQVNLVASYVNAGLAGTISTAANPFSSFGSIYDRLNVLSAQAGLAPIPVPASGTLPGSVLGGYGTALSSVFGGNYQSASVALSVDLTLRNRTAHALASQSAITGKRLKLEQSRVEQAVEVQVRNALQALQTARQRITAAQASEAAAKEKLDSETRLFQTGESTNFLVLTRQNEYLDARRRTVVAQLESNRAVARLEQAMGSTLGTYQITLPK